MATTLKLQSITPPYTFESLGIRVPNRRQPGHTVIESDLFPIGSVVTLTSGNFPLTDYRNLYNHSNSTHVIGGRTVRIDSFDINCVGLNENRPPCEIYVVEDQDGGKRRKRVTKHRRSKRSRRRGSRHRR
jgi:hypothetical protein